MPSDLAATFEHTIRSNRLMDLDVSWANELIFPYYNGLSIRNLAHTVVRLLNHRWREGRIGASPLDGRLWARHTEQVKRVILFISDGLGWQTLHEFMADDPELAQIVADLTGDGTLTPITSIAPSTTAVALPSIWTGAAPIATGMVGTKIFLREFSMLANMLHYVPEQGKTRAEVLEDWGFNFETFVPLQTLGETLRRLRIPATVLLEKSLFDTGLSRIMHRGINSHARHVSYTDLWITLRHTLQSTRNERAFVNVYWSAVDSISHLHGTTSEHARTEVRRQLGDLRDTLAADGIADGRTLFMLAADHGHTPISDPVSIPEHPVLAEALRCGPGGESRFAHLYLRHDFRQQVEDYVRSTLGEQLVAVRPSDALAAGLFGTEDPHPETAARLGDLTLIARANAGITGKTSGSGTSISRHGSLTEREMLVPLLMRIL